MPVTFPEAALGAEVKVPDARRRPVTLRVPPGTPTGQDVPGQGPGHATRPRRTGDLLVTVDVVVPAEAVRRASARRSRRWPRRDRQSPCPPGGADDGRTTHEPAQAVYVISVAAELAGVHPQTLRIYERKGLVEPGPHRWAAAAATPTRDIERLRRIQELTNEGVNLAGVKRVIDLEHQVEELRAALEETRSKARDDVDQAHRSYRRELVPLSQAVEVWGNRRARR